MRPHVVLSGPPGSGKTTVGRALAARLGLPFVDVDADVEAKLGAPIAEIFSSRGEAAFRSAEAAAFADALGREARSVIAPGAGALLDAASMDRAFARALVVGLVAPMATRLERLERDSVRRPLLDAADVPARLAEQDRARRDTYALAHLKIDATEAASDVAARLAENVRAGVVPLRIGPHAYAARLALGRASDEVRAVLRARAATRVVVVTDVTVKATHGDLVEAVGADAVVELAPGEPGKRLAAVEHVLEALARAEADRDSVLVAVGGGVVSDLGGLAAALFARGIDWVAVPTTLLAMVDAAVGGKTGANLAHAKNLVGAFHHPIAVVVDPTLTTTESPRAIASGLAEAVKTALIGDAELFAFLGAMGAGAGVEQVAHVVRASLAVKARVVEADPRERGLRAILNFGHTFGHAFEAATAFSRWTHGEAVALGMVHALNIGARMGDTPATLGDDAEACLRRLGLPTRVDRAMLDAAHAHLAQDKKRIGDQIRLVLVTAPGVPRVVPVATDALASMSAATFDAHEFGRPL